MKHFFTLLLTLLLTLFLGFAQAQSQTEKPAIKLIAKSWGDSITLRWAPTTAPAWKRLNYYGYVINRITIKKRGQVLYRYGQQKKKIAEVKVSPETAFAQYIEDNDYVGIMAQALFGESFDLEQYGKGPLAIYNQALALENRYSFALFAADQDVIAAQLGALRFTDTHVAQDEEYLYVVRSLVPQNQYAIDSGYAYIATSNIIEMAAPSGLEAAFGDHGVQLQWDKPAVKEPFTGYIIERSTDNKNFQAVNKQPFVATEGKKKSDYYYYIDSLPQNDQNYFYRIRGRTAFGELSAPSEIIKGKASPQTQGQVPILEDAQIIENKKVVLTWQFPTEIEPAVSAFVVYRSRGLQDPYEIISKNLSPKTRTWEDKKPFNNNFYRVGVIDKQGNIGKSITVLGQLKDSIPPQAPTGMYASIDSNAHVTLHWDASKAEDIQGYQVFRSYNPRVQYVLVSKNIQSDTLFYDSLPSHSLNTKVYYQVVALDWNGNSSDFSEAYPLSLPDHHPPTAPVFKRFKNTEEGVHLYWVQSSSNDLAYEVLYYKAHLDSAWEGIARFDPTDKVTKSYLDQRKGDETTVYYQIRATDQSGLESTSKQYLSVQLLHKAEQQGMQLVELVPKIAEGFVYVRWKEPKKALSRYELYRATNEGAMRLFKILDKETIAIEDRIVERGNRYAYRIRAIFADGKKSDFSKLKSVSF